MEDKSENKHIMMRTAGRGGNEVLLTIRFSFEYSNGSSPRITDVSGIVGPRAMDKCKDVKKRIFVEDKVGGSNGTLITACAGGKKALQLIKFSVKGVNGAPSRSAFGGGNGASKKIDECEGVIEGSNVETPPIRDPVINSYVKHSRPVGVKKGGSYGFRKVLKSSGHDGKRKGSGAKLKRNKNVPTRTGHSSLIYSFRIYGFIADNGR